MTSQEKQEGDEILIYEDVQYHAEHPDTSIDPIELCICTNDGDDYTIISLDWKHLEQNIQHHCELKHKGRRDEVKTQRIIIAHPDPDIHNRQITEDLKRRAKKHNTKHVKALEKHNLRLSHKNRMVGL